MDVKKSLMAVAVATALAGCGGGGGSSSSSSSFSPSGSPVDGPLAHANVELFELNLEDGSYTGGSLDTGETDAKAAITGISIKLPAKPIYVLEFKSDADTVDLDTGTAPVIGTLRTVITAESIANGSPIYATPLTTMTVDLALQWYEDYLGGDTTKASSDVFKQYLDKAQKTVKDTLGFGLVDDSIDIFETPPLITDDVASDKVQDVVKYRAAAEAAAKVVEKLKAGSTANTEQLMSALASDLGDGAIDGQGDAVDYQNSGLDSTTADTLKNTLRSEIVAAAAEMRTTAEIAEKLEAEKSKTTTDQSAAVTVEKPATSEAPEIRLIADADDDGIPDNEDNDSDNDGVDDANDAFPLDSTEWVDTDGDGIGDESDSDDDGDGVADADDDFPLDKTKSDAQDQDGDGWHADIDPDDSDAAVPGVDFVDTDRDGLADEGGDNPDSDDDNDGVADTDDAFPKDPKETTDTDGDKIGDNADTDDDGDGVLDKDDPKSKDKSISTYDQYDLDRDGIPNSEDDDADNDGLKSADDVNDLDPDTDDDGYIDSRDDLPENKDEHLDSDKDGTGNNADTDDDNDGVADDDDAFPLDKSESVDTDGDKIGNNADTDDDNDGVADADDAFALDPTEDTDTDKDGTGDNADTDDDNDGVADDDDAFPLDKSESVDTDGDGVGDNADDDSDNDGVSDDDDAFAQDPNEHTDTDKDGTGNNADTDDDNDGVADSDDAFPLDKSESVDTDGDKIGNNADTDDDGDGVADSDDAFPLDKSESVDTDGDKIGNNADTDDDGDGVADSEDAYPLDATASRGVVIDGGVFKGLVAGAEVKAFAIENGASASEPLGTAKTSSAGTYEITIPAGDNGFSGGPVIVKVYGDTEGATMVCDVEGGCDDDGKAVAWGEPVNLNGKGLVMTAVVADVPGQGRITTNVTTLTNMAAQYSKDHSDVNITTANRQVANLFGLSGSLTELPVVDITKPEFATASEAAQKNALLSTAIWRAGRATDSGRGVGGTSRYFSARNGQFYTNDNTTDGESDNISLDDIYFQGQKILNGSLSGVNVASLRTWVDANKAWADAQTPMTLTDAQGGTSNSTDLETVKTFFSDLRTLVYSSGAQSIESGAQSFSQELDMAGSVTSDQSYAVEQALQKAMVAIAEAVDSEYSAIVDETSAPARPFTASNGVSVAISNGTGEKDRNFSVNQSIDGVSVTMTAGAELTVSVTETGNDDNGTFTGSGTVGLDLSGTAQTDAFSISLKNGAFDLSLSADDTWTNTDGTKIYKGKVNVSSISLVGDTIWAQKATQSVSDPVTFTGKLSLKINNLVEAWDDSYSSTSSKDTTTFKVGTASFTLSGEFSDSQNNSLKAALSLSGDGKGLAETETIQNQGGIETVTKTYSETETNFPDANFSLVFTANLPGVDSTTQVTISGERTGLNDGKGSVAIQFLDKIYTISGSSSSETLKLSNNDGVELMLGDSGTDEVGVTLNGVKYAKMSDSSIGTIIRYTDGTFETF